MALGKPAVKLYDVASNPLAGMTMLLLRTFLLFCLIASAAAQAQAQSSSAANPGFAGLLEGSSGQADFLPVDQAFRVGIVESDQQRISIQFDIAPEYYLYRHRLGFDLIGGDFSIDQVRLPDGVKKTDEFFGDVEVYYNTLGVLLELGPGSSPPSQVRLEFQGCADAGLCYPPESVVLDLPGFTAPAATPEATGGMQDLLTGERFGLALALFFLAGLGLTFTPCVLPMLPILSSLVLGRENMDRTRAALLASSYVLGMAITFALVGALIGLFGAALNIQARLQSPWVLITFAIFFVLFALAMFGAYELRLPASIREPFERLGSRTRGGSIGGAAMMGALSTLVVSPCISAPLAGALVYISTTGDAAGGALSLFVLALGMGAPLLIVALFGSALLPRSGPWLDTVKQLFGFGLLGVAIWLLERIVPGPVSLGLWAALTAGLAVQLGLLERSPRNGPGRLAQTLALLLAFYSAAALTGALSGGTDPLRPLAPLNSGAEPAVVNGGFFTTVNDQAGIQRELEQAKRLGKPAIIELYADWCISCKVIERKVINTPQVRQGLEQFVRIKLDLTENTPDQRAWLTANGLFGPPAFLFFDSQGDELRNLRIQGEVDREDFQDRLRQVTPG
ncbi:MAG TPA: protein-disulfide reductase DsbD [Pseudomonas xinjiangensis]|uniref:Thiol:disulfide interchange protein DsbD n=2 Tax=root TaxID=1 RepID=A0A7V1BPF5_9GAMM|nr:protein-disulfide reductase DsbD [Halopseudomonas xinjiangensis]HEC49434.1 protein-disulfide reductase DsbD [Halopseudomonas xinjiangensis]